MLKATNKIYSRIFWVFANIHLLVWTLLPTFVLKTIPLDTAEGIMWGSQWQWGYYKHPPLAPWLTQLAYLTQGSPGFSVYLLSQIAVVITFWAVWKFSNKVLPPLQALASVICLEGIYYYTFPSVQFNPDILMLPIWALLVLFFYKTLKQYSIKNWMIVGILGGLGILTKYETIILLAPMLVFLIINSDARKNFKKPGFYLGLCLLLLIITPNMIWLINHNFIAISYAINSNTATPSLFAHFTDPWLFIINQFWVLIPTILLLAIFIGSKKQKISFQSFDSQFMIFIGLGAFLFTLLASLIMGISIKTYWAIPYFSFFGTLVFTLWRPIITLKRFKYFLIATATLFILLAIGTAITWIYAPLLTRQPLHTHYPAKNITNYVTTKWEQTYYTKLIYIVGPRSAVSYIATYAPSHPAALINFDTATSPWIDLQKINQAGAVLIWKTKDKGYEQKAKTMFPQMIKLPPHKFKYMTPVNITPLQLTIALIPPKSLSQKGW